MLVRTFRLLILVAALALAVPALAGADTFTVTKTSDTPPAAGTCATNDCSLRQAIEIADKTTNNVVVVPAGEYILSNGELQISQPMKIQGAGAQATVVDAAPLSRVFGATSTAGPAAISGLTIRGGTKSPGGGIRAEAALSLSDVVVTGNSITTETGILQGAGIASSADLTIVDSVIANNSATATKGSILQGAGIYEVGGKLSITGSTISGNSSTTGEGSIEQGGGILFVTGSGSEATVEVVRATIEKNKMTAGVSSIVQGGAFYLIGDSSIVETSLLGNSVSAATGSIVGYSAIESVGSLILDRSLIAGGTSSGGAESTGAVLVVGKAEEPSRIVNSTITGNAARGEIAEGSTSTGGGLDVESQGQTEVVSSTISSNSVAGASSNEGGDVFRKPSAEGTVLMRDTIVANGAAGGGTENCAGPGFNSAGHNLDSLNQCGFTAVGDRVNTNPLLAPLAANGGATQTLALLPGSPAIDAGAECLAVDQRGVTRPQGPACDIGAFELVPPPPALAPPPVAPRAPHAAELTFKAKKIKVDPKTGKGALGATCAADPGDRCEVSLVLQVKPPKRVAGASAKSKPKQVKVGAITGSVTGGTSGKLAVKLNRKGRALLVAAGKKGFGARAGGTSKNASGAAVSVGLRLKVLALAKKKQ